eukprot:3194564-Pleurochrysis_carterae.AAC.1
MGSDARRRGEGCSAVETERAHGRWRRQRRAGRCAALWRRRKRSSRGAHASLGEGNKECARCCSRDGERGDREADAEQRMAERAAQCQRGA